MGETQNPAEIETRVVRVIAGLSFGVGGRADGITPELSLVDEFGEDEIARVEIVFALENEFDIDIHGGIEDGWKTVADVIRCFQEALA